MRDKFLFGFNESFSRFREDIYRDGQRKPKDPLFTLAFVVSQAVSFEAAQQTNKLLAHSPGSAILQTTGQKAHHLMPLPLGSHVYAKPRPSQRGSPWIYGQIIDSTTPRSYSINTGNFVLHCNRAQLRPARTPPKQPLPLLLMQPSVPATPGHKPAQPLPAAPLQIERTVTPPPTQPQQQEQQISETPVVHVNQQTTRSGQLVRLPEKYKDFVLS